MYVLGEVPLGSAGEEENEEEEGEETLSMWSNKSYISSTLLRPANANNNALYAASPGRSLVSLASLARRANANTFRPCSKPFPPPPPQCTISRTTTLHITLFGLNAGASAGSVPVASWTYASK